MDFSEVGRARRGEEQWQGVSRVYGDLVLAFGINLIWGSDRESRRPGNGGLD